MKIEIVGSGCIRCVTTEKNAAEAIKELGIQAEIIKITNVAEFAKKGVVFTPAVIVDSHVKVSGRVPAVDELKKIFSQPGNV